MQENSSMQELAHSMLDANVIHAKMKEFEIEMERLAAKMQHLKAQNEVLSLTLDESKNHCDNLTVLIGERT